MSSRVVVAVRVNVPRDRAFEVFVSDIGAWWRPNSLFRTAETPGTLAFHGGANGVLVETAPDGSRFEIGRVLEWVPPERLRFSWRQVSFPPNFRTEVEVRFEALDPAVTRVSVEHRGFDGVPADSAARHGFPDTALQMRLAEWWRDLLERLGNHARTL